MAPRFLQNLLERRVPQYVAVYLGGSWAVIEFFAFLEDRLLVSPHLTNLVLAILALILPSVVVFTYFHGRPGADRWRRFEKVFIPVNLLVAAVVLLAGFGGKELGAVTTTVSTQDEEGNTVERVVPKSEFRKRLALFPPDAPADSPWLGQAFATALNTDLFQDMFLDVRTPVHYIERLRERGLSDARAVPRPLKREVTREMHLQHFVDGELSPIDGGYRLQLELHDADRGDVEQAITLEAADLLALADSASLALRRALELPAAHLAQSEDVPVAEMTTESEEAFRHYAEGLTEFHLHADYDAAEAHLEKATELDPTFAYALYTLYAVRMLKGEGEAGVEAMDRAMDHLYRLPERAQFAVKAEHYALDRDLTKALAVQEMRAELYPQDIQAHLSVAQLRRLRDDVPGIIDALEHALELDPTQTELLRQIGSLHQEIGELDQAETYFQRYVERLPDRPEPYTALAGLHLVAGEHERALEAYEKAQLLDPSNVDVLVGLSELARYTGDWDAAEARAREALDAARTPQAREKAYRELRRYFAYRGDYVHAVEYQRQANEAAAGYLPPVYVAQFEIVGLEDYVRAGRADQARERLDRLVAQLPAPTDALVGPGGRAALWVALGQPDSAQPHLETAEEVTRSSGFDILAMPLARTRGRMHELRGEWQEALDAYRLERKLAPWNSSVPAHIGRIYRELGDLDQAEAQLIQTLRIQPANARANYDLGRVYLAMDRPEDAVRHLERAVDAWAVADPADDRVLDARTQLDQARLQLRAVRPRG